MDDPQQLLPAWKVREIVVLPDGKGVQVTMSVEGHDPVKLRTRSFGIGKRGARAAALAKFSADSGYGAPDELYKYLASLPREFVGDPFPEGPFSEADFPDSPVLKCVWPTEDVA